MYNPKRFSLNSWLWFTIVCLLIAILIIPPIQPARADIGMPQFIDIAPTLGINLVREMYGHNVIDYNNDGRLDLFFSNHNKEPVTFFEQQPSGEMVDVTTQVGINPSGDYHGTAWGDCDNDGRPDLYLTIGVNGGTGSNPNRLYRQLANHTFVEIATSAGVDDPLGRSRASSWVDYDNDGDLDLHLTNMPREDALVSPDKLFRNEGNCTFTRVDAGDLTSGYHLNGASWADYDNDGDMDVFVSSTSTVNMYRNQDGQFVDVTTMAGIVKEPSSGMAWGDYDNDGDLDLFVARGWSPHAASTPATNRLYRNNGNGTFTRVEKAAGVSANNNSHHAVWADFDNDGDLDLYVTNGGLLTTGNPPNYLYMNKGNGVFEDVAQLVGTAGITSTGLSGGATVGDVNADGFLDIVLSNGMNSYGSGYGPNQLFLNQGNEAHWLQIKLVGQQSNRLGIGARAEVTTSDGFRQMREMNGGFHHYSQNEMLLSFGLGQRDQISNVTIYWPSGVIQQLTNVAIDQRLTLVEPGDPAPTDTPTPEPTATKTPTSEPTATDTPTPEPTATDTPTLEPTATETPTATRTPTPGSEVEPALQGYWTLNETSGQRFDGSSHIHHLADRNTVASQAGQVGLAADFERNDKEYLLIEDNAQNGLDPLNNGLTLVGWFRPETLEISQVLVAKYDPGISQMGYRLDLRVSNRIGFMISPDGVSQDHYRLVMTVPFLLSVNTWYHLAAVFNAQQKTLTLYLDGQQIGWRSVTTNTIHDSSAPFMLGASLNNGLPREYFDGLLDEWRIYSRPLSSTEIQNLMSGIPSSPPTSTPTATPTATLVPTNTPTPEPTATNTPTPEPTATETPTPEPTATDTPTPEPTATDTPTPEPTATETPTPEPTATYTPTPEPTATETPTPEPTATNTPTPEPTATDTPTPEPTATETPTM